MSLVSVITTAVQRNLGNRTDTDTSSIILESYNMFMSMLMRSQDHPLMQTTVTVDLVSGKYKYMEGAATGGCAEHLDITDRRLWYKLQLYDGTRFYEPLKKIQWNVFRNKYLCDIHVASGKPVVWSEWAGAIYLYPKPDAIYTLYFDYYKKFVRATTTSDTFVLDDEFLGAVIAGVTAFAFLAFENTTMCNTWLQLATSLFSPFNIDLKRVIDMETSSKVEESVNTPQSYADPFVRK